MKKLLKNQKGFTIIEVMIVLVIAAVILLIVFIAVPALQRNSRNTQLKNDVASVLGQVSEFASNNAGQYPGSVCSDSSGNVNMILATTGCTASSTVNTGKVSGTTSVSNGTTAPAAGVTSTIVVALNRKCDGNALASGTANRIVAALFNVESSSGTTAQCQQS